MPAWLEKILCEPTTSVPEAGRALKLSRNASYQAASRGEIPTLQMGRMKRVPTAWLRRVLQLPPAGSDDAADAA